MHTLAKYAFSVAIFSSLGGAWAYDVPKRSLDARVQAADIVVIGTVVALDDHDDRDPSALGVATVKIGVTLKGAPVATIRLVFRRGIAELSPMCCSIGKSYFMMLRHTETGLYTSVDGPYGVLDTDPNDSSSNEAVSWPGRPGGRM
jgi:hypothetical protein